MNFCCLVVMFFVPLPQEGYQNPCLPIALFAASNCKYCDIQYLQPSKSFKSRSMRHQVHQRPILPCRALPSNQWRRSHLTNTDPARLQGRFRLLQPNIPFRTLGFATQHSFEGLGFCNPTLLYGLGFCNPTLFLGPRFLQPNTPLRLRVLQPNTPLRASVFATQHSSKA